MACSCSSGNASKMEARMSANWYICSMRCSWKVRGPLTVSAVAFGKRGSFGPQTAFDLDLIDISSKTDHNFCLTVFYRFVHFPLDNGSVGVPDCSPIGTTPRQSFSGQVARHFAVEPIPSQQGGGNMPAYGNNLSPAETTALIAFLETLHPAIQRPARDAARELVLSNGQLQTSGTQP